ncbi:nucleotidyltransferase domain-containing protein [Croceibacterium xixiisoli]|uniref:nucleotidyltransferase domain-containing protein n=1 Tax=Croceibacterium xixiisoli TaxID=1476466 RepID=UPI00136C9FBD|nr:nucleotidyltransferase domain-containing protein [Croceibacterium xixiisoli]
MNGDSIGPDVRAEIERRLAAIEAQEDVRFLLAIESGSRAWGFPSPDSDYDIRFIHVHRRDWYLSLMPGRDVIERPIVDEIDLNGWDIRKALNLLFKSNAVVSEWMESPIHYRPVHPVMARVSALADRLLVPRAMAWHYAKLATNAAKDWLDSDAPVPVKKYFYALRPALCIRHMRLHGGRPPMNLQQLVATTELTPSLTGMIEDLVAAKAVPEKRAMARACPLWMR